MQENELKDYLHTVVISFINNSLRDKNKNVNRIYV